MAETRSFRLVLYTAVKRGMQLTQVDVASAYLNANLDETIYMLAPLGSGDLVWRLQRPLYGLRQAGHNWRHHLDSTLKKGGFLPTTADPALYYRHAVSGALTLIALHVDDMIIATDDINERTYVLEVLRKAYKIKVELDPTWLLHIRINYNKEEGTLTLDQQAYIEEVLASHHVRPCRPVRTPAQPNIYLPAASEEDMKEIKQEEIEEYQSIVGALSYLAAHTRPDLAYVAGQLGRHLHKPNKQHMQAAQRALRYLASQPNLKIVYKRTNKQDKQAISIIGYSDANYAQDQDRHSIAAYAFFADQENLISWQSHRLHHLTCSTEEAELSAASEAAREAIALQNILGDLKLSPAGCPVPINIDNKPACSVATNLGYYPRLKHVDVRHKFVAEAHHNRLVAVTWTPRQNQAADFFTKPLPTSMYVDQRRRFLST